MAALTGKERSKLRAALSSAFTSYDLLRRMALDQLNFDLNTRTDRCGVLQAVDELIDEMSERRGRPGVFLLIEAARAERPENPLLRVAEQVIMGAADLSGDIYPIDAAADGVAARDGSLERVIVDAAGFPRLEEVVGRIGAAEYRVCLIDYRLPQGTRVCGTGFLVSNDLVMTNNHVISRAKAENLSGSVIGVTFGYRSSNATTVRYALAKDKWLITSDNLLDYTLLALDGSPGSEPIAKNGTVERGFFKLVNESPMDYEPLLILQHPFDRLEGNPSTLRLTIGFALPREDGQLSHVIRHSANTDEGSSGSPVFSGRMDLIGLHNWGGRQHNEAIKVGDIRDHLASTGNASLLE